MSFSLSWVILFIFIRQSHASRLNEKGFGIQVKITDEIISEHGLSAEEYERILSVLEREPNLLELGIFSVMWSEHCSYKSSRLHLKNFPTTGKRVIEGPGENAGVVDIGDGLACVFKMESHKPSLLHRGPTRARQPVSGAL